MILFPAILFAQKGSNFGQITGAWDQNNRYLDMFTDFKKKINTPVPIEELTGSPYLNENFVIGQIFEDEDSRGKFLIRYNIYNDVMEALMDENQIMEIKKDPMVKIFLSGRRFTVHNYVTETGIKDGYFEILEDGDKIDLLVKHKRIFKPGERAKTSFHVEKKPELEEETSYYIFHNNENAPIHIKRLKEKYVLDALSLDNKKIKALIKSNDLKVKTENDLKILIQLINKEYSIK